MTEKERELAKMAVEASVNGFKNNLLANLRFTPQALECIEDLAESEIKDGLDDIDRIDNPNHPANCRGDYFYVEYNHHWPM